MAGTITDEDGEEVIFSSPTEEPDIIDGGEIISEPAPKYYVNGVNVAVLNERIQYMDGNGKLITGSLKDYQFDTKAVCIPLVSSTGHGHASLKNVHYQEGRFALGTILVALTSKDESKLDIQFLHLYLAQLKDQVLVPLMSGAANVALSVTKIKNVEIPLPPIKRQQEIVQKFKSIVQEEDELNSELVHQQTLLKMLAQKILEEAIEGKLTVDWRADNPDVEPVSNLIKRIALKKEQLIKEKILKKQKILPPIGEEDKPFELPEGWAWCRLDDIVSLFNGSVRRGPFGSSITKDMFVKKGKNTFKVYEQKNAIYKDKSLGSYYIPKENYDSLKSFKVRSGDIIISCAGTIGETYILPDDIEPGIINQALLKLNINSDILIDEYFIKLFQALTKKAVNEDASGSAMKNMVSLKHLRSKISFPIPPLAEQKAIVTKVEKLLAVCDRLGIQITQSQGHAEQLMRVVLKEAFSYNSSEPEIDNTQVTVNA